LQIDLVKILSGINSINYSFPIFFLIIFFCGKTPAQQSDSITAAIKFPFIVDSILVEGNDITEEDIILRELTFQIGDTVSYELLEYNQERIFSLGIFTKVELIPFEEELKIILIHVEESWYIYPIPFAELTDKDWNKISYGFYVVIKNFRGRNETIQTRAAFGYDPSFSLSYYKPTITKGSKIFFEAEASYQNAGNRSFTAEKLYGSEFDQKFILAQILIGKRFGLFHWLSMNFNYNYVETPAFVPEIAAGNNRIDRFPSAGINYTYDTRDLIQFPKNGIMFQTSIQYKGWGINDINYSILNLDFREYRNLIGDLYAKWRVAGRFGLGKKIPFYDYSFLGYAERIRGYFNVQEEGNESYIGSVEFFHPIIKDLNISFDWVPLLPKQLLRYRIALYTQLFADTGTVRLKGEPISIKKFNTGFGAGLTFLILPYNSVRLEYASDEYGNPEFIFDIGVSF